MVGIVIVSHSHQLAMGIKELAEQMTQGQVPIAAAGGMEDNQIGTSFERISGAIETVFQAEGVLVLFDLGSAELTTQLVLESLPKSQREKVLLSGAPLVEGTIAGAVEAYSGSTLAQVEAAAEVAGCAAKYGTGTPPTEKDVSGPLAPHKDEGSKEIILTITNDMGLHARTAARFAKIVSGYDASVKVRNLSRQSAIVDGRSVILLVGLGARQGEQISIRACGLQAGQVLGALEELLRSGS